MNGAPGRRQQRSRHCSYDRGPLGSTCAVKSLKCSNSAHRVFGAFFRVFRRVVYLRNRRLPLKWGKSSVLYLCIQKCAQKMPPIKKKKRTKVDRNFGEQGTVRQFILYKQLMKVSGLNSSLLKYTNCKIKHLKLFTA